MHECEYPDSHLWVTVTKQRGAIAPYHPSKSTRTERDLVAILARVFADTIRRGIIRDYGNIYRHPVPIYAPVCWAGAGEVYAFLPLWRFWDQEEGIYELMIPKASRNVGRKGHRYVRIFKTPEEAAAFFGSENASPLRMHLMSGAHERG